MSEIALYRKYRPKKFSEVIGQEHIIKVLEGALKQKNTTHAYLFCGSRGTGKTSLARIFADTIGTTQNDLCEIDAASNRGIDDIRALREAVNTLPFESKFKVYIIDEVHMLTKEAFNALLKTLEEPPSHIIFILATTESEKLPETIVSRCQSFIFKKPNQQILKELVLNVAKKEGFKLEPSSADIIALLGDGSFRDTLGILQKVISSSVDKLISVAEVEIITGTPKGVLVNDFISAVVEKDGKKGFDAVENAITHNVNMKVFLKLILKKLKCGLLLKISADFENKIKNELTEEDFEFIKKIVTEKGSNISSVVLLELLNAYDSIERAYLPELSLEIALTKIIFDSNLKSVVV